MALMLPCSATVRPVSILDGLLFVGREDRHGEQTRRGDRPGSSDPAGDRSEPAW